MIRAYECGVKDDPWPPRTVHAISRGQAKLSYFLDVSESWPDVRFIDITCRVSGQPRDTRMFSHVCNQRGVNWHIGDRVIAGGKAGYLVDAGSGANFLVHCEDGIQGYYHPSDIQPAPEMEA